MDKDCNRLGQSEFLQDVITKGDGRAKPYNKENVYQLKITNFSAFQVTITSRQSGVILINSGKEVVWYGHPQYPTKLDYAIKFNAAASATDYITIETITSNGDSEKRKNS